MIRAILCIFALASLALADTVRTKDGQRLEGEVLERGPAEVVLRTRYGVLVIPTSAIERIDGAAPATARPAEVDVTALRALRLKARRQAQTGRREAALATYAELLALDGDDVVAHVESCALRAQLGQPAEAALALRRAVLAGLTDLEGLLRDPRLAAVKDDPALVDLLAQRAGLLRLAARKAPARVLRALRAKGATAAYRDVTRDAQRLVLVHALDDAALETVAAELEAFVAAARADLFRAAPDGPLVVTLVADEDRAVLGDATATFDATTSTLTLAPFPSGTLARAPAARRELARALHALDQQARRARHPAWLEAGLVEHLGGGVAAVDTQALALVGDRTALERRGRAARVAAGSLVRFLAATDALAGVYEAAAVSPETEAAWRAWVAAQALPPVPFTGLVTTATPRGLRVTYVQPESGAARAGLVEADLVVALDGLRVRSDEELQDALRGRATGDEVEVTVLRDDLPRRATVTLTARPPGPIGPLREAAPYLGVAVEQAASGVTIRSVDEGSPAAKADLRAGDLVVSLDGHEVATVRAWLRALRQKQAGQQGALVIERAGARVTVVVELVPLG